MKITFITVSAPAIKNLIKAGKEIELNYENVLELKLYYGTSEMDHVKSENMITDIKTSDLVFVDLMGSPPTVINSVYEGLQKCLGDIIPYGNSGREYLRLGEFTAETMKSRGENTKMNMRNYSHIMKYFKVADQQNIQNMLYLILREYGGFKNIPKPKEPREVEDASICHPSTMKSYESFEVYEKDYPFKEDKPIVAILFYSHIYPVDTSRCIGEIKNKIEEFANVLPITVSGAFSKNKEKLSKFILKSTSKPVDLILNFMSFRLGAGPMGGDFQGGIDLLKEAKVPYLHPYFMSRRTKEEWENSIQGCSTSEVMISVMLPELDGAIETYPVGAMVQPKYNVEFDVFTDELELISERVDRLMCRIKRHIALRKKDNKDKRVAIICYNYPPGESNLFGGAFLDTFASVENILKNLKTNNYSVNNLKKEELMEIFTAGKAVNSGKYGDDWEDMIRYKNGKYKEELKNSNDYEEMIEQWGDVPGRIMTNESHEFFIPGTIQGNVFIGLQPSRGVHEESDKVYHDKTLLPHHQYQAFYKWIREEFKADAIIHVGTHGTLEFLKGKECGMSGQCYPDMLLDDIPHMYLYYCGNPSEGIIAKRRSHGNLISYQPPVFIQGELYGEYSKLMSLIDNYHQARAISPQNSKDILLHILDMAKSLNLPEELEEIESELYRMKMSLIPHGLHVFGKGFNDEESREYVKGLLRYSRNGITSLRKLVGKAKGYDIEELIDKGEYKLIKSIDKEAEEVFSEYMDKNQLKGCEYLEEKNRAEIITTLEYGKKVWKLVEENYEIQGLLHTLSGIYNPAKLAGDIYRNPEVLPTGYNLYQFDPRLIPTRTAYERGNKICENTLEAYKKENGSYPLSTAIILWGLETSRTQGESFSQILSYLGVKMLDSRSEWESKYEIIPIKELGRPRIDVTINICGFFRDMFPNLIETLDNIFSDIYDLEESDEENYFKANSKKMYEKLISEGYSEKEAKELCISRIFGPKEGEYGTGITKIIETKNWEKEEQLGSVFISSLQHVYNRKSRGKRVEGLYEENLKAVEIVSQIRSNHEYEITDLDHYYEYFGGLAKSVEMVKGKKVKMYITDTTGERVITENVEKSIERGVRTRLLNPKWIEGMLEHKYHGVQKIAQIFENIMGLAATTNRVEEWIYNDMYSRYLEDEKLKEKIIENNPYAYVDILEQMMEYNNRGYWKATEEQIQKIKDIYLQVEGDIEEKV